MAATILPLPKVNEDARRAIFEIAQPFGSAVRKSVLVVKEPATLGNHYHRKLTETFLLASGKATLVTQDIKEEAAGPGFLVMPGERVEREVEAPCLIVMSPMTAHVFRFEGPAVLVCDSDQPFDAQDLIAYKLL